MIRICGFDPSLRNWGYATATYYPATKNLVIDTVGVIQPTVSTHKQVRQNSKDMATAMQLFTSAYAVCKDVQLIFVEIPIGSQSARAMASYGACIGILGSLQGLGKTILEVTPTEVKMVSVGNKNATKEQMIDWALRQHPDANWPMIKSKGVSRVIASKAEHMADAVATIYAGMTLPTFSILESTYANYSDSYRR